VWGSSAGAARAEHQSWSGRSAGTGDGEGGALWDEEERRSGGVAEGARQKRLEKTVRGRCGSMGMGIFWVPVYLYDGRGIRLMWVGQAGVPWWFQKP